jgi:SAM-dependent methyltransferase
MSEQSSGAAYIHGTDSAEQQRLALLNRLTNRAFIDFLRVPAGARVLEVGSGLGILASEVAAASPGVSVVGVERSPDQIAAAVVAPNVTWIQGDAHSLDFPDGSFDLVYARYLLEHVADPAQVLREMRRVARPGARVAACENDISLFRVDPPCPAFEPVWSAFAELQRRLGGDALIGRRLFRLFRDSGFEDIELSFQPEVHWYGSPAFAAWIENLIGNIESGRAALISEGLSREQEIEAAIRELREIARNPDASSTFSWNRASALR